MDISTVNIHQSVESGVIHVMGDPTMASGSMPTVEMHSQSGRKIALPFRIETDEHGVSEVVVGADSNRPRPTPSGRRFYPANLFNEVSAGQLAANEASGQRPRSSLQYDRFESRRWFDSQPGLVVTVPADTMVRVSGVANPILVEGTLDTVHVSRCTSATIDIAGSRSTAMVTCRDIGLAQASVSGLIHFEASDCDEVLFAGSATRSDASVEVVDTDFVSVSMDFGDQAGQSWLSVKNAQLADVTSFGPTPIYAGRVKILQIENNGPGVIELGEIDTLVTRADAVLDAGSVQKHFIGQDLQSAPLDAETIFLRQDLNQLRPSVTGYEYGPKFDGGLGGLPF